MKTNAIRNKSYNTVSNGYVASYEGESFDLATKKWLVGHKPKGTAYFVTRQGYIEAMDIPLDKEFDPKNPNSFVLEQDHPDICLVASAIKERFPQLGGAVLEVAYQHLDSLLSGEPVSADDLVRKKLYGSTHYGKRRLPTILPPAIDNQAN